MGLFYSSRAITNGIRVAVLAYARSMTDVALDLYLHLDFSADTSAMVARNIATIALPIWALFHCRLPFPRLYHQ